MTLRYVDSTLGNDAWNGLSPTFVAGIVGPKATLNGAEDSPVAAGDIVHVRPGVYRETLTIDVSGAAANVIEYRGDYTGAIWASTAGQVVRISGSNNDQTLTRNVAITASAKHYRTFTNLQIDCIAFGGNGAIYALNCTDWTLNKVLFMHLLWTAMFVQGASQLNFTIQNCALMGGSNNGIDFYHTADVSNVNHLVQNCLLIGYPRQYASTAMINSTNVGGVIVKNCSFRHTAGWGVNIAATLAAGQTVTVNNCIFDGVMFPLAALVLGEIVENNNTIFNATTARTNVAVGAASNTYPPLWDSRWFFQMTNEGAGPNNASQVITPYDLGSYSQLIDVAGTSPSATDMRGTGTIGAQREWGALEYDSTLKIEGGSGAVSISPFRGNIG